MKWMDNMFANQTEPTNIVGQTLEERDALLARYRTHRVENLRSATSFLDCAHITLMRVGERHPYFKDLMEKIDREAMEAMEGILVTKMRNDEEPTNLRAWELLTRNRIEFRPVVEEIKPAVQRLEIAHIDSREMKEQFEAIQAHEAREQNR